MTAQVPNFFIVGAARAGTTAVAHYLAEHPQVYMSPVKEPSYFAREMAMALQDSNVSLSNGFERYLRRRRSNCVTRWEDYLQLFRNVTDEVAVGEASTIYLISPSAPSEIRSILPDARIIILLRNPVETTFSTYLMLRRSGKLRASFSDIIRSGDSGDLSPWRDRILETRKIAAGVRLFLATFPKNQVRWYFHGQLSGNPQSFMRDMYTFLNVSPDFHPELSTRHNVSVLPRAPRLHRFAHMLGLWDFATLAAPQKVRPLLRKMAFQTGSTPRLSEADRELLLEYFKEEVADLSDVLEIDLSGWLGPGCNPVTNFLQTADKASARLS